MDDLSINTQKNSALRPKSELPWDAKEAWIRLLIYYTLILAFMITLQLGFGDLMVVFFRSSAEIVDLSILVANIQGGVIGFIGIALTFIFLKYDDKKFRQIGVTRSSNLKLLLVFSLIVTLFAVLVASIIELAGEVISFDQMLENRFKIESDLGELISFLLRFAIVFGGIAIGEEIIFRGYIQNLLQTQLSFTQSTIISSILFGLIHSLLLTSASKHPLNSMVAVGISATIFGFVFAYAYRVSGNIVLPILIHGIWNNFIFFFNTVFNYETAFQVVVEIFSQLVAALIILYALNRYKDQLKS